MRRFVVARRPYTDPEGVAYLDLFLWYFNLFNSLVRFAHVVMCASLNSAVCLDDAESGALSCRQAGGGATEIQSKAHCSNSGFHR